VAAAPPRTPRGGVALRVPLLGVVICRELRERRIWGAKASQHRRRNRTPFFAQENWFSIVQIAICGFEFNEAKSRTAASGSIGEIVNQLRHYSPMNREPISILDRFVTFVQGDEQKNDQLSKRNGAAQIQECLKRLQIALDDPVVVWRN
jgi:hypothetical protein